MHIQNNNITLTTS